jgi:hypothetical protein
VAEIVTDVVVLTADVVTVNPLAVVPSVTVTLAGTLATAASLLDSATTAPPAGAAPDIDTKPDVFDPAETVEGLIVTLCSVTPTAPAVTVNGALRVAPLYVAVIVTEAVLVTGEVAIVKEPVKELAGTVTVAGTLATDGLLLDSETTASAAGPELITIVPLDASPPATLDGLTSTFDSAAGGGAA